MTATVSAYIITKNEEHNIARAIESVLWMDEIIVLDSGSSDDTRKIAKSYGATVSLLDFPGFAEQKNRAMSLCTSDWLFNLDADEEVTPELRQSIERVLAANDVSEDCYEITRKNHYLGRWMLHSGWYPEYRARLSFTGKAEWKGGAIHESLQGNGESGCLSGDLLHRPYANLGEHINTIGRYTKIWAERENAKGRAFKWSDLIFRPPFRFLKMFVLKRGFLDGGQGLIAAVMGSFYVFMKYARLYEIQKQPKVL